MKDDRLISLNAAIDALDGLTDIFLNNLPPTIYKEDAIKAVKTLPSAQPSVSKEEMVGDTISRQAAIKAICEDGTMLERQGKYTMTMAERKQKDADLLDTLPPAQHTALTADDIETIRIHLSAFKERLWNQGRWTEAAEYEKLIQRLTGKGGHDGKG